MMAIASPQPGTPRGGRDRRTASEHARACVAVTLHTTRGTGRWTLVVAVAVFLLPTVVLWPQRSALPVADDFLFTRASPPIDVGWSLWYGWEHSIGRTSAYRPLATFTYRVNQVVCAGAEPRYTCYRLTNYALHGACAASLLWLALGLGLSRPFAALAAVAFALHPASHENVLWISGRTYPLAAMFGLWTLVIAVSPPAASRTPLAGLAGVTTALALASYEGAAGLPLVAVFLQWLMARQAGRRMAPPFAVLQIAVLAVYIGFRWTALTSAGADFSMYGNDLSTALGRPGLLHRLAANGWYFFARGLASSAVPVSAANGPFAVTLVALAAFAPAALATPKTWPALLAAAALAVGGVAPFLPTAAIADRFTYLLLAAVALVLATALEATWARRARMRPALGACTVVLLVVWTRQYVLTAREWSRAGEIAERVLTESLSFAAERADASSVDVFQVPPREGRANVLVTYFEYEMRRRAGRDLGVRGHVGDAPVGGAPPVDGLWLRWNRETQHTERIGP